jgi:translation initiation factor IF-3
VEVQDALSRAREAGLDLVEVAPQARPPVCRIMDYGKWKYAQRKKEQRSKAKRHDTELKEIRIKTPKIGANDLKIKVDRARRFLERGDRVQFTLRFRGRELAHIDEGQRILREIAETVSDVAKVDRTPFFQSRRLTMTLMPTSTKPAERKAPARPAPARPAEARSAQQAQPAPADPPG